MQIYSLDKKRKFISRKKIGGKCKPFIKMSKNKISIPKSFVLISDSFVEHIDKINLWGEIPIKSISKKNKNLPKILKRARRKIENKNINDNLKKEIVRLKKTGIKKWAIRSSANIEDDFKRSWAGRFESFIGVEHKEIEKYAKKVWASVFSERVVDYLKEPKNIKDIKMAILMQEVIDADVSGVCFTTNISEKNPEEIAIEAVHGMGEYLVEGRVTPDKYIVEKESCIILEVRYSEQKNKLKFLKNRFKKMDNKKQREQKLTGDQIIALSKIAKKIEKIFKRPMDIEWCLKNNNFYILQSRPIIF